MIDEALFDAEEKMEKAVAVARDDLSTIRTGRANPGMFSRITIDYYGAATPITQLASINVPEARLVVIKPYEANQLRAIETALQLRPWSESHQRRRPYSRGRTAAHRRTSARAGQTGKA